ncbi:MAG: peptide chain release factor N(5)-glutamine methyltransferase [Proteobacteria bacterium]|nr:MAG: peptide chain release factor N(5)-glutamine methyltransferase [Pseudomonadota bacterium]
MTSIREAIAEGAKLLERGPSTARLDAEVLLSFACGRSRTELHAHPEQEISPDSHKRYRECLKRRAEGEPCAYITGVKEFWGLNFIVTPEVLIPRPETEHLVEAALEVCRSREGRIRIADLGTGSGCITVALAYELKREGCEFELTAVDNSAGALAVAERNAKEISVENCIKFIRSDWFSELEGTKFDMIVSNPPYVSVESQGLCRELGYEPEQALYAEDQGLSCIRTIFHEAPHHLNPGGELLIEIGQGQAELLTEECKLSHWHDQPEFLRDLAGIDRVLRLRKSRE